MYGVFSQALKFNLFWQGNGTSQIVKVQFLLLLIQQNPLLIKKGCKTNEQLDLC